MDRVEWESFFEQLQSAEAIVNRALLRFAIDLPEQLVSWMASAIVEPVNLESREAIARYNAENNELRQACARARDLLSSIERLDRIPRLGLAVRDSFESALPALADLVKSLEALEAEQRDGVIPRRRPRSITGWMSIELFNILRLGGVRNDRLCCKVIADILIATNHSQSSEEKLRRAVFDRVRRITGGVR